MRRIWPILMQILTNYIWYRPNEHIGGGIPWVDGYWRRAMARGANTKAIAMMNSDFARKMRTNYDQNLGGM